MSKKILLVGNTSWSMIKFRQSLLKALVKNNYQVYVVAPKDEYSKLIEEIGCEYIDIKMANKGTNPIQDLWLVMNLYKLYKQVNPDLIIHYTIKPNIYGTLATKLAGLNSFAVITGLGYTFINQNITAKIAKRLYKISLRYSNKVFFINNDDLQLFVSNHLVSINSVDMLPSEGINTNFFLPMQSDIKSNKFIFLLIARMLWDKGVGEYIEAAKIIKSKYQNIEFQLLGYLDVQNPKAINKVQMAEWVDNGIVNYLGSASDVREYIANSNCVVLPSYREGVSMTLMESASMSKPLIATNVPGCKDLIDNNINGYLCEVKNPKDLADKMEKMINLSEHDRIAMGQAGREKMILEFDEKIVIRKYLKTIMEIL